MRTASWKKTTASRFLLVSYVHKSYYKTNRAPVNNILLSFALWLWQSFEKNPTTTKNVIRYYFRNAKFQISVQVSALNKEILEKNDLLSWLFIVPDRGCEKFVKLCLRFPALKIDRFQFDEKFLEDCFASKIDIWIPSIWRVKISRFQVSPIGNFTELALSVLSLTSESELQVSESK